MKIRRLQTRFVLAGCLLALIAIASGLWSAWTFDWLGDVVDQTLRDSRKPLDLAAALADSLEREDDALLLALSGDAEWANHDLSEERRRGDAAFERLGSRLAADGNAGGAILTDLRRTMDGYRDAVSALSAGAG
jgi:NtrC-family two-component system sensor histidine kinase KinB